MTKLDGRVVAVTGGARGIGDATAHALAAAGARVAIGDLDADLAARAAQAYGGLALPLDVTSQASFAGFLDKVVAEFGRIDGLVNNAGIMVIGRHLEVPLDAQLKQLDINLRGVILGCHEAAGRMVAAGGGQIVNIASLAGRIPSPGSAVYSGTKAAVLALSEALGRRARRQRRASVRGAAVVHQHRSDRRHHRAEAQPADLARAGGHGDRRPVRPTPPGGHSAALARVQQHAVGVDARADEAVDQSQDGPGHDVHRLRPRRPSGVRGAHDRPVTPTR